MAIGVGTREWGGDAIDRVTGERDVAGASGTAEHTDRRQKDRVQHIGKVFSYALALRVPVRALQEPWTAACLLLDGLRRTECT